jgi:protein required for attachment to host cells
MRIRIVVADQSTARWFDTRQRDAALQLAGEMLDPLAHLHDRDFKSDRPGRVFDHASAGARRGAVGHHGTGGEETPRKHEAESFAHKVANALEVARRQDVFDRLVIMAAPAFLGLLRKAMPDALRAVLSCEIDKNLVHSDAQAVKDHLPREVFET